MAGDGSLWPVVVGGLLTMVGGAFGSGVTIALKLAENRDTKKKERAKKFEELVEAVYKFDHWLTRERDIKAYGQPGDLEISPFAALQSIAAVHFPMFNEAIRALDRGADTYELWIFEAAQKRLDNQLENMNQGINEAYKPYLVARQTLLKELTEFAEKEFQ